VPLESYDDAEARGIELYQAGAYDRAIRMFELAQTLPGDGYDYERQKSGGMIGSASAPPNPRELQIKRFATSEQKMIAQYNIACCCAGMGDTGRALDILRTYLSQVRLPLPARA
jgi:tetratricopeptide (TPR) repeat protein